jgi:DNA primase large subunit
VLNGLSKQHVGDAFGTGESKSGEVQLEDLEKLAEQSFPMCMKQLHTGLTRDHKLRYGGRQQYGLFIKGIGITLEDSLAFWQREFTQVMSNEAFTKGYVYNIRHNYGKEGKRANYTPFSCQKIIMGAPPGPGEHHGCPFRHYNEGHLKAALAKLRIKSTDINDIVENVNGMNYQMACRKHFEVTHAAKDAKDAAANMAQFAESVGNHPNAFFDASRNFYAAKDGKAVGAKSGAGAKSPSATATATTTAAAASPTIDASAAAGGSAMVDGFENPDAMDTKA